MFNEWLLEQLKELDWSQADLARASGLTTAAISKYINGRTPDQSALRKLAKAFKLPPDLVFEKAGILPPKSDLTPLQRSIMEMVKNLPENDLAMIEVMLRAISEKKAN
jgi:transcriptional regulator with XRE-family HTH domain